MRHHLSFTAISHQRFLSLQPALSETSTWLSSSCTKIRGNLSIPLWTQVQAMHSIFHYLLCLVCRRLPILPWLEGYSHCSDDQERSSGSFGLNTGGWYHLSTRLRAHTSFVVLQHCLRHWINSLGVWQPRCVVGHPLGHGGVVGPGAWSPCSESLQFWEEPLAGHRGCRSAWWRYSCSPPTCAQSPGSSVFYGKVRLFQE